MVGRHAGALECTGCVCVRGSGTEGEIVVAGDWEDRSTERGGGIERGIQGGQAHREGCRVRERGYREGRRTERVQS